MKNNNISRRGFLAAGFKTSAAVSLAVPNIIPSHVLAAVGRVGANDRINMAVIGVGKISGGMVHAAFHQDKHMVALCDVNRLTLNNQLDLLKERGVTDCLGVEHYEEVLDRSDIDAVGICTPDHWHVSIAIDAMRKGKDVFVQKPVSLTVEEGKLLVEAEKKYGRVLQVGSQQRSESAFRKACELVKNGYIGDIVEVECSIGTFPPAPVLSEEPIPETLNYDKWLGPAAWHPYNSKRVECNWGGGWRCFYDYGCRKNGDFGAHHFDIVQWALGMDESGPVKFVPKGYNGEPYQYHEYANGIRVFRDRNEFRGKASIGFKGTEGFVGCGRGGVLVSTPRNLRDIQLKSSDEHLYYSNNHDQNWYDCIRSRESTICPATVGHRSSKTEDGS